MQVPAAGLGYGEGLLGVFYNEEVTVGVHEHLANAADLGQLVNGFERTVLFPVLDNGLGAFFTDAFYRHQHLFVCRVDIDGVSREGQERDAQQDGNKTLPYDIHDILLVWVNTLRILPVLSAA